MENAIAPRLLTLSTSLSEHSRSRQMCRVVHARMAELVPASRLVDLRDHHVLPYGMQGSRGLDELRELLTEANGVVIGFPVYNYTMSASLKAVIERFGRTFENKVVGIVVAAGGRSSYMCAASLSESLMFDYRTWIVPRFVYATKGSFEGEDNRLADSEVEGRLRQLAESTYAAAWRQQQPVPGLGPG